MPSNNRSHPTGALVHHSSWTINRRVIGALILREMLTRYGRNNLGFLWLFLEPMLFTLVVTAFWAATRTIHGSQIPIVAFAVTGYSSVMLWRNMPSRCIGALNSNKPLLHHRQVTIVDIYFSRIVLEFMASTTSFVVICLSLVMIGWMPSPENAVRVLGGWMLLAWFGAGLALLIGSLSERFDVLGKLWPPFSYLLFPLSGVAFIVDALPPGMQKIVLWLPMLNALEYLRDGWFGSFFHAHYDLGYVLIFNLLLFFAGLSLARQVGFDSSSSE
ncbi:MAG TPA: ABC transporter permease [Sphingomicrobium sp.]|jgi:ABC-2 type transport system permease protein/capsular polysaccharide transport system permease protein